MHPFAFFVILSGLAAYKAQLCSNDAVVCEDMFYVSNGEPVRMSSCGDINGSANVTWFKNDSQISFTSDPQSRIHQNENVLWFIPASLDDAGLYTCNVRNVTYCTRLIVFENEEGLCYNRSTLFYNEQYLEAIKIVCPSITDYVDVSKAQVKWSKNCNPLQPEDKYLALADSLSIKNSVKEDEGLYTCAVQFHYNGTEYSLTRTIELKIAVLATSSSPMMLNPSNSIQKVELGSPISLKCEAINGVDVIMIWMYNNSFVDEFYGSDTRVIIGETFSSKTEDGELMWMRYLNFTEIKEEDYNRKFYCQIANSMSEAYVMLQRPDGKLYDAYIMYPKSLSGTNSYPMDIFVLKVLPEVLEVQFSYRLFIFGRDVLPGEAMSDVIDEAISQSRRLVIVLGGIQTRNYLKDDFEQQIAMYDALIRNKIKVILIELEKGTDYTSMPESIQYIKQKQGAIRWKGEFTQANTKFWKHMRYYMPPTQAKNLQHSDSTNLNRC
ncbi:hypothetical protein XENTR_v10006281 [Xenopus tropicalis]|nr:hypothetical protein XENTR_v10006281 [Xenopus tropicalis]